MNSGMTSHELSIRANLTEPYSTWFEMIKRNYNFESNTETIRHLIKLGWETSNSEIGKYYQIHKNLLDEVEQYINRKDIQQKYRVYSLNEFVNKAVQGLLREIVKENTKNILHFDIRKSLNDEELQIAMAFEICLNRDEKSKKQGVSSNEIASELNRRDIDKIESILDNFVYQNLLERIQKFNKTLYYAEL